MVPKGVIIARDTFIFVPSSKEWTFIVIEGFVHCFEDDAKMKIPFDI